MDIDSSKPQLCGFLAALSASRSLVASLWFDFDVLMLSSEAREVFAGLFLAAPSLAIESQERV